LGGELTELLPPIACLQPYDLRWVPNTLSEALGKIETQIQIRLGDLNNFAVYRSSVLVCRLKKLR
jgi:hypothetical protein